MVLDRLFVDRSWMRWLAAVPIFLMLWLGSVDAAKTEAQPWRYCANQAQMAFEVIRAQPEALTAELLTLVCADHLSWGRWNYILHADGHGPMLQYLLDKPDLKLWLGACGYADCAQVLQKAGSSTGGGIREVVVAGSRSSTSCCPQAATLARASMCSRAAIVRFGSAPMGLERILCCF